MSTSIAKTAGFCFGVKKAVDQAFDAANSKNEIYALGQIIHNRQVNDELKNKGVIFVDSLDKISNENSSVLIRAHGVPKKIYDEARLKNINIIDTTCLYVKKIHNLVHEKYMEGYKILIIGDGNHPEVIGINGWCENSANIIDSIDLLNNLNYDIKDKIACVAQTTFNKEKWKEIIKNLKNKYENLLEFDTICSATSKRQAEAKKMASINDVMIVLGGKNSSNTHKLYEICKSYCNKTYKCEGVNDLPKILNKNKKIGITAGASTPEWVIEEVYFKMNDVTSQDMEMNFDAAIDNSFVKLSTRSIVKGKVISKSESEVFIDLGYKADGIIQKDDFEEEADFENLKAGDELEVYILKVNDGDGNVLLSRSRVKSIRNLDKVEAAFKAKEPVEVKVKRAVKGGLVSNFMGIDVFIPASQVSDRFIRDLEPYVGQKLSVLLTEFNPRKRRVIGSSRILIENEKEQKLEVFWSEIEEGKEYEGTVKSFMSFGAFVDLGVIDGLVHISELSWSMIKHPSDVLKIGDTVKVFVLGFDKEKSRISLGYKRADDNPWNKIDEKYPIGKELKAKVLRLLPFGAFVELEPGVEGLVHISQISRKRIGHPGEVLKIDDVVDVKVLELNVEEKKIGLSIKALLPEEEVVVVEQPKVVKKKPAAPKKKAAPKENTIEHREEMGVSIGDILNLDK